MVSRFSYYHLINIPVNTSWSQIHNYHLCIIDILYCLSKVLHECLWCSWQIPDSRHVVQGTTLRRSLASPARVHALSSAPCSGWRVVYAVSSWSVIPRCMHEKAGAAEYSTTNSYEIYWNSQAQWTFSQNHCRYCLYVYRCCCPWAIKTESQVGLCHRFGHTYFASFRPKTYLIDTLELSTDH